ncbi:MAG: hypothetical protein ACHQ0J_12120 [Candidatus Dormibacterales bacterium]
MNTRSSNLRHLRIAGLALGAVAVAGMAVLVTASASGLTLGLRPAASTQQASRSSLSQATTSTVCSNFISHLASDLGKSQSQLNSAIQKAIGETLADEVKSGKLTQAQADKIKTRLAGQALCTLPGGHPKATVPNPGAGAAYRQELLTAAASALGITSAQLKTDLAHGMSLSQIAAAQKPPVTEAAFRSGLIAQLKPLLDSAVAGKKLTQAQEDAILKQLQTGPIPFWNKPASSKLPAAAPSPA